MIMSYTKLVSAAGSRAFILKTQAGKPLQQFDHNRFFAY